MDVMKIWSLVDYIQLVVLWSGLKSSWLMVQNCLKARVLLANLGIQVTVDDVRFCKPLDIKLVRQLCEEHSFWVTVEEESVEGFGSYVVQFIALDGKLDGSIKGSKILYMSRLRKASDDRIFSLLCHKVQVDDSEGRRYSQMA
ncbi:hypothetical protein GIB67_033502 [Kingdonia uniflora]|uniref:Transketolase C-terminal domain-containing protein n=1 Tax=Kingdonia uniflora TaxID=39325 RepID=A0A7J7L6A8_9MAGN|nr:hypothetical protein GIB67_033502 [Kingdonia uniflora]